MKITSILGTSKEALESKAVERKAKALKRGQEKLIDSLEEKRDKLEEQKEKLLNVTTDTVNENTWNEEFQDVIVDLDILEAELKVARRTMQEYFTDESSTNG